MPEFRPSRSSLCTVLGLTGLLFWATSAGITRQLVEELGAFRLLALQFSISSTLLFLIHGIRQRGWRDLAALPPRYLWPCTAAFLVCLTCFSGAFSLAGNRQAAVQLVAINYLWPAFILLLSVPMLKLRVRPFLLTGGVILGMAGVIVTFWRHGNGFSFSASPRACLVMLLAAVAWGFYSVFARKYGATASVSAMPLFHLAMAVLAWGVCLAAPRPWHLTGGRLPVLLYSAVFVQALAYWWWDLAMRHGNFPVVVSASYLLPVGSVVFAGLILAQPLRPTVLAGGVLLVCSSIVCRRAIRE